MDLDPSLTTHSHTSQGTLCLSQRRWHLVLSVLVAGVVTFMSSLQVFMSFVGHGIACSLLLWSRWFAARLKLPLHLLYWLVFFHWPVSCQISHVCWAPSSKSIRLAFFRVNINQSIHLRSQVTHHTGGSSLAASVESYHFWVVHISAFLPPEIQSTWRDPCLSQFKSFRKSKVFKGLRRSRSSFYCYLILKVWCFYRSQACSDIKVAFLILISASKFLKWSFSRLN